MSFSSDLNTQMTAVGLVLAAAIWVWRAIAVGFKLGELTQQVKNLRYEVNYIRTHLDDHLNNRRKEQS